MTAESTETSDPRTSDGLPAPRPGTPGGTPIRDLMTTPVVAILDADTAWTAMERFVVAGTRHLVVVTAEGRCVGILANHHLAALWPMDPLGLKHHLVRDLLAPAREAPAVPESATVTDAARMMVRHGTDAVTVVDRAGEIVGVVTGGDIIRLVAAGPS